MSRKISWLNFVTKIKKWEYWPFEIVYLPIFFYWLYLSYKARSLFFFSAANPSIETGGMLGESKYNILEKINELFKPKTIFIENPIDTPTVLCKLQVHQISYPFIAKPDVGERGWMVEKIDTQDQLESYLQKMKAPFLIQEYIDFQLELGLFYYRYPGQQKGTISSVVQKEFLHITGDGKSTLHTLIVQHERARLQYQTLKKIYRHQFDEVLASNEVRTLVYIGNHCRGTKFINANHLINQQLTQVFDRISQSIVGFYYGRFDIRCKTLEDLYKGENIKILELNGAGAEPAHIYDPAFPFLKANAVLFHHWTVLYRISKANHMNGVEYMSWQQAVETFSRLKNYRKRMQSA